MPTFNSTTYANQIGGLVRNRLDSTVASGEVRIAEVPFAYVAGQASGDICKIFQLPQGVQLLTELSGVINEAAGSAVTITAIGDQAVANRYSTTAITLTAAAIASITPAPATTIPRVTIDSTNDVIQVTLGGTVTPTVGKQFWLRLHYRLAY